MKKNNTIKLGSFVIIFLLLTTIFSSIAISTIQGSDVNTQKHERKKSFIDIIFPKRRGRRRFMFNIHCGICLRLNERSV